MKLFDRETIRRELTSNFGKMLEEERWDSIFALTIIFYCEKNYGAVFLPGDLLPENFSSIDALLSLLEEKLKISL